MLNVYPTYKDSGIEWQGQIPAHWDETLFFSVAKLKNQTGYIEEDLLSVYLDKGVIRTIDSDGKQVHKPSEDLSKYQLVDIGDFVMNNQQCWRGSVGVSSFRGIVSPAYHVFELSSSLNYRYANYLLRDQYMVGQYKVASKGVGSIQQILYFPWFKKCLCLIPPQEEQRQIVAYLDYKSNKIDERICQRERELQTLSELKQAEIATVVTRGLDPNVPMKESGIEWLGKIPAHWEMMRAKYMFNKEKRAVRTNDKVVTCFRDGQVTLRENRRISGFTESLTETGYQGVRKGDLVIHQMDAFAGAIGVSDSDGKGTSVYHCCTPKGNYSPHYYAHLIREMARSGYIESLYRGIRERSSDFNYDTFSKQYLPIPPREEQDAIVSYLQSRITIIDNYIAKLKEEINYLQEYKQRLISDVVTGKVDVRGVEIPNEE